MDFRGRASSGERQIGHAERTQGKDIGERYPRGVGKEETQEPPALPCAPYFEIPRGLIKGMTPGTECSRKWRCHLFTASRQNYMVKLSLTSNFAGTGLATKIGRLSEAIP